MSEEERRALLQCHFGHVSSSEHWWPEVEADTTSPTGLRWARGRQVTAEEMPLLKWMTNHYSGLSLKIGWWSWA